MTVQILGDKKVTALADQAVFSGTSFLSTLLLARVLTPADFGRYASVMLFMYLLVSMSNALVVQPFQVTYARIKNSREYFNVAFWLQVCVMAFAVFILCLLYLLNPVILASYRHDGGALVLLTLTFLLHDFFRKTLLTMDLPFQALQTDAVVGITQLSLLAVAFANDAHQPLHALGITAVAYLAGSATGIYVSRPGVPNRQDWENALKEHLMQGKWLFLTAIIQWWAANLFAVSAGMLLGSPALGALRLVQTLFGVLNVLLQSYENYALPQAVKLFQSSVAESKTYLKKLSVRGALAVGIVLSVLFLFSESIIVSAGGEKYRPYAYLVRGMSVLYFIIFVGYPIRMAVRMMAMDKTFFSGYVLSFFISLGSCHLLLQAFQLWGALIGLIANQLVLMVYWQYRLSQKQFILWR